MSTRREFIALLGGTAVGWPAAARAQQPAMPVIGFLRSASPATQRSAWRVPPGLKEAAMSRARTSRSNITGRKISLDRLPAMAAEFVRRPVAVIVCNGIAALAAKAATATMPIVFATGRRPGRAGPRRQPQSTGGNVTGVSFFNGMLAAKRLELLHELVPKATLAVLVHPNQLEPRPVTKETAARHKLGLKLLILSRHRPRHRGGFQR